MSVLVSWDDESSNTIIFRFAPTWTWQEFLDGFVTEMRLIVTRHMFILMLMRTLIRLHPEFSQSFLAAATLDEAHQMIQQYRTA